MDASVWRDYCPSFWGLLYMEDHRTREFQGKGGMKKLFVLLVFFWLSACENESGNDVVSLPDIYQSAASGNTELALSQLNDFQPIQDIERYEMASLRGNLLFELGRDSEAIDSLEEAISLYPSKIEDYVLLATALSNQSELQRARDALVNGKRNLPTGRFETFSEISASTNSPEEVRLYLLLAELENKLNNAQVAISVLEEGLLRNTGSTEVFEALLKLSFENDLDSSRSNYIRYILSLPPSPHYVLSYRSLNRVTNMFTARQLVFSLGTQSGSQVGTQLSFKYLRTEHVVSKRHTTPSAHNQHQSKWKIANELGSQSPNSTIYRKIYGV